MLFKIDFRKRALKEFVEATGWYQERSSQAAENFATIIQQALMEIKNQPYHFRQTHKDYREVKIKKYPYSIVYFIDAKKQSIIITTIFHHKRNPNRKFK